MKISEMRKRLAQILEVPEDPERLILERVRKREFPSYNPSILGDIFARAFTLDRIWKEFQEVLEKEGRGLTAEVTELDLQYFSSLTKKCFSQIRIPKSHRRLREKVKQDKERFLEAIAILERELFF